MRQFYSVLVPPGETSTSGWGSFSGWYSLGSWFSTLVFRSVPRTVPENIRIHGFKMNSPNLDRPPRIRNFVVLNFWNRFLVTLPSICSEICVIYSSVLPGKVVFSDWLLLGYSRVSLDTAGNFCLFLDAAFSWRKSVQQFWRLKYFVIFSTSKNNGKHVQINDWLQTIVSIDRQVWKIFSNIYNKKSTSRSPNYTFSSVANKIVYTPRQGTNREKHLNQIIN